MTGNKKLIERLRAVIDTATSDSMTVENDRVVTKAEHDACRAERDEAEAVRDLIIAALTPTDDEREALVRKLEDEVEYRVRTAVALHKGGHDHEEQVRQGRASVRFLAAGFPRSEPQVEPSDALNLVIHAERVGTERDDPLILELAEALRVTLRAAGGVR